MPVGLHPDRFLVVNDPDHEPGDAVELELGLDPGGITPLALTAIQGIAGKDVGGIGQAAGSARYRGRPTMVASLR